MIKERIRFRLGAPVNLILNVNVKFIRAVSEVEKKNFNFSESPMGPHCKMDVSPTPVSG